MLNLKYFEMLTSDDICKFLLKNEVGADNISFIRTQLNVMKGECFRRGYLTAITHAKKRREKEKQRRKRLAKNFLDYLSDITHSGLE